MAPTLSSLKSEYDLLFESCLVRPARAAAVDSLTAKIRANRSRYAAVGKPLGVPWFVVGILHAVEANLDFTKHLHNGEPLTARTIRSPAGRPATGKPPFTWEVSAGDALTLNGLAKQRDWSIAGVLYALERSTGWDYREQHPEVHSPSLWGFSNHYTRGEYAADGTFSPSAVAKQCGGAVLVKRLAQTGETAIAPVERQLQLTTPHLKGPDVEAAQRLLAANPYGTFGPGTVDGDYGTVTADAVQRAKFALGYPDAQVNRIFGPVLESYLDGSKPLPKANQQLRNKRLAAAPDEASIRKAIVDYALWGVRNTAQIAYSQSQTRLSALDSAPKTLPLATDCSGFATLCYRWAGAPNPNFAGPYNAAAGGYTGTLLAHCRHVARSEAKPGDLVVWTPPADGSHVCVVASADADPWLVSHGSDAGPSKLRFSVEDAWQRAHGHVATTFLSVF